MFSSRKFKVHQLAYMHVCKLDMITIAKMYDEKDLHNCRKSKGLFLLFSFQKIYTIFHTICIM